MKPLIVGSASAGRETVSYSNLPKTWRACAAQRTPWGPDGFEPTSSRARPMTCISIQYPEAERNAVIQRTNRVRVPRIGFSLVQTPLLQEIQELPGGLGYSDTLRTSNS